MFAGVILQHLIEVHICLRSYFAVLMHMARLTPCTQVCQDIFSLQWCLLELCFRQIFTVKIGNSPQLFHRPGCSPLFKCFEISTNLHVSKDTRQFLLGSDTTFPCQSLPMNFSFFLHQASEETMVCSSPNCQSKDRCTKLLIDRYYFEQWICFQILEFFSISQIFFNLFGFQLFDEVKNQLKKIMKTPKEFNKLC